MRVRNFVKITMLISVVIGWAAILIWSIADFLQGDTGSGVLAAVLLGGLAAGMLFAFKRRRDHLSRQR
jgi:LPXTG-motif cell wall-anchored protein